MKEITGVEELDAKLRKLAGKSARRVARKAVNEGLTVITKAIRDKAPEGATKGLKASIGKRHKKNRQTGLAEAKAGVNVGKKNPRQRGGESAGEFAARRAKLGKKLSAPHAHLVALGTKQRTRRRIGGRFARYTKSSKSTGVMPANKFVQEAFAAAGTQARDVMLAALAKGIAREAASK